MQMLWSLLCLLAAPLGVLSQLTLRESGPGLVKPSQSLSLTCVVSGGSFSPRYYWNWIRQRPGRGLEWLGSWSGDTSRDPTFQGRISITADTAQNQFSLQLSSMTTEDTAVYYCAKGEEDLLGSGWAGRGFDTWGQGALVTVSSESKTSPRVFPLSLRTSDPAGQVAIACLVQGFFPPEPVRVTWSPSKEGASIRNFPVVKSASGNLYTMSSQLTLPASQCPDGTSLQCQVEHYSSTSPAVSVPCRADPPPPCSPCNEPRLSLHKPALEDLLLGSNASITCTLSGLKNPEGALFSWTPSGKKEAIQKPPERDSCGCYSVSSVLPGCAEPWNRGENFSCTASHPELKTPKTDTISKVLENTFRPQVHLLPPPSEELALNELVSLTCLVRGFSPKDVLVRWLQGSQELSREKYLTWGPLQEPDQSVPTFATTSVLRVSAEDWKQGEKFSCMVGHEALPLAFTQKTIDRLADRREPLPWLVLDLPQEDLEEDAPGASLWPTTVTLLTLFLLSLFYSTALTVTSVRGPADSREGPQY